VCWSRIRSTYNVHIILLIVISKAELILFQHCYSTLRCLIHKAPVVCSHIEVTMGNWVCITQLKERERANNKSIFLLKTVPAPTQSQCNLWFIIVSHLKCKHYILRGKKQIIVREV
jgi:hypothetical protein